MPSLQLKSGGTHRILDGHPWVFRNEVGRISGSPQDGDAVEIYSDRRQLLGTGFYNGHSQICARRYSRQIQPIDRAFLESTLARALAYRSTFPAQSARRLFWSESDGLPGLIVDRYGDILVMQSLTTGIARHESLLVELLANLTHAQTILLRNDAPVRQLEGLPLEKKTAQGEYVGPTHLEIAGLPCALDLWTGHKTGFYLDQIDNYLRVAAHAAGRRVLDVFCNQGAFALLCRKHGATSCLAVDQSAEALRQGRATAERAGLEVDWLEANAFDWLRQAERNRQTFDLIILDPPSFTKTKQQVDGALRGYRELHVRALRMLPPGGLLATFSCSHSITDTMWRGLLREAAVDVGASLRVVETLTQSRDHPVLLHVPETEYLRGFLVEKI